MTALVSILITCYNRARYLPQAIASLEASKFQDFEAIIVDDCSTDNSFEIAKEAESRNRRFRAFRNTKNLGQFANRNKVAEYATGIYLKYLDSDDVIYPYSLSIMTDAMGLFPTASLAICHSLRDDLIPYPQLLSSHDAYYRHFLQRGCLTAGPSSSIIRREKFEEVGGYRSKGVASDLDLWYRMSAHSDIILLQPSLIWWRQHSDQAFSHSSSELDYIIGEYDIAQEALTLDSCPLHVEEKRRAISRARSNTARRLMRFAVKKNAYFQALSAARKTKIPLSYYLRGSWKYW